MDYNFPRSSYGSPKSSSRPAPRRSNSFSSSTNIYQHGPSVWQNPSAYGYENRFLNGKNSPMKLKGLGSYANRTMVHQNSSLRHAQEVRRQYDDAIGVRDFQNRSGQGIDEVREGIEGVERLAKELMVVLKLKNAITYVADVVELYDGVDSNIGHFSAWARCAGSHFASVKDAVNQLRKIKPDCKKLRNVDEPKFVTMMLQIVRDLDRLSPRWLEAYERECESSRCRDKARLHRPSQMFETGWLLEDLKRFLQNWKEDILPDVEDWLKGTKERCNGAFTGVRNISEDESW